MLMFPILFLCCMIFFVPESPQFLLSKNRDKDAEKSLRFYRNYSEGSTNDKEQLETEMNKLKENTEKRQETTLQETLRDFSKYKQKDS